MWENHSYLNKHFISRLLLLTEYFIFYIIIIIIVVLLQITTIDHNHWCEICTNGQIGDETLY